MHGQDQEEGRRVSVYIWRFVEVGRIQPRPPPGRLQTDAVVRLLGSAIYSDRRQDRVHVFDGGAIAHAQRQLCRRGGIVSPESPHPHATFRNPSSAPGFPNSRSCFEGYPPSAPPPHCHRPRIATKKPLFSSNHTDIRISRLLNATARSL